MQQDGKNPDEVGVGAGPYREGEESAEVLRERLVKFNRDRDVELERGEALKCRLKALKAENFGLEAKNRDLEKALRRERKRRKLGDLAVALVAALSVAPLSWCFDVAPRHGIGYAIVALLAWMLFWRTR